MVNDYCNQELRSLGLAKSMYINVSNKCSNTVAAGIVFLCVFFFLPLGSKGDHIV